MTFEQMLQDLVNQDDDFKTRLAVECYVDLLPTFQKFDPKTDGMIITYAILATTAAADGELTQAEFDFIDGLLAVTGHETSEEDIINLVEAAAEDSTAYEIVKEVKDNLNDEGVSRLINLIAAICSIDDRISVGEIEYLKSLLD